VPVAAAAMDVPAGAEMSMPSWLGSKGVVCVPLMGCVSFPSAPASVGESSVRLSPRAFAVSGPASPSTGSPCLRW